MPQGKLIKYFGRRKGPDQIGSPPPPLGPLPNSLCTGLVARSYENALVQRDLIDGVVIQLTWAESQPDNGLGLDSVTTARVLEQLNWCSNNNGTSGTPLRARLRIEAGYQAPQWVKSAVGGMTWYAQGPDATGPLAASDPKWAQLPNTVPMWWKQAYLDAYDEWIRQLAEEFGNHPALAEVVLAAPMTEFVEPLIKQFGCLENRQTASTAGWTRALDNAAFESAFDSHNAHFGSLGVATYTAYNPADSIFTRSDATLGYKTDPNATIALMEKSAEILSRGTVIGNNSLKNPMGARGDNYTVMYQRMIDGRAQSSPFPWPISFQTATLKKIEADYAVNGVTTLPATIDMAISWGAFCIELPIGCEDSSAGVNYISPAAAKGYNTSLRNNAAGQSLAG